MTQKWRDAIFVIWPVPAAAVARVIPNGLEPDLFNGTAWVSLVPFRMENLRIRHLPPIPGTSNFGEVNVRTYVRGPNGPGVWFCSLDVHAALATLVARTFYRLPYYHGEVSETQAATTSNWKVRRKRPEVVAGELEIAIRKRATVVKLTADDLKATESTGVIETDDDDDDDDSEETPNN